MATISFANLSVNFSMLDQPLTYDHGTAEADPDVWAWLAGGTGAAVAFYGSGFTYTAGVPEFGGTVTDFGLNFGNSDLAISGLSLDISALAPLTTNPGGTQQEDLIWYAVLNGDDTIDFGTTGHSIDFAGDADHVASGVTITAGNDSITGSFGFSNSYAQGDAEFVNGGGTLFAGNDTIAATGSEVIGDAYSAAGVLYGATTS